MDDNYYKARELFIKLTPTQQQRIIALCSSLASQQERSAAVPLAETQTNG